MTFKQETHLSEQIAALHDTAAQLADAWDNGGGPDDPATWAQIEQLTLRAAAHLLRIRDALARG